MAQGVMVVCWNGGDSKLNQTDYNIRDKVNDFYC